MTAEVVKGQNSVLSRLECLLGDDAKRLSTIYGRHRAGMDYALVCEAAPVTVAFL